MLTKEKILLTWEQDWDETKYFTFTREGDSIGYDVELDQFYFGDYNQRISHDLALRLLA